MSRDLVNYVHILYVAYGEGQGPWLGKSTAFYIRLPTLPVATGFPKSTTFKTFKPLPAILDTHLERENKPSSDRWTDRPMRAEG